MKKDEILEKVEKILQDELQLNYDTYGSLYVTDTINRILEKVKALK